MSRFGRWTTTLVLSMAVWGAASLAQAQTVNRVMRMKLEHSQKILESVVTSNWAALEQHGQELQRLANDPAWAVLKTREYGRQSEAFLRAVEDLIDAAKRRDLEAAPSGLCVDDHELRPVPPTRRAIAHCQMSGSFRVDPR